MWNEIIGKLSQAVSRRGLLGKAASASAAVVLSILGAAVPSSGIENCGACSKEYYQFACCCLCTNKLCTAPQLDECIGQWCWTCLCKINEGQSQPYNCTECYYIGGTNCFT
jgi:hypothetical protein